MRLFILGAGQGKRLSPITDTAPKCVIDLGDNTSFLSRLIKIAEETHYIKEIDVITGHAAESVEKQLEGMETSLKIKTLYNPFYEVAGPIVSLWIAHEYMSDFDFLVCNGDTLYERQPFDEIWTPETEIIRICIDRRKQPTDDDMKVRTDASDHLVQVGKDIPSSQSDGVSIGLLMVKGSTRRQLFLRAINRLMRNNENVHKWQVWHKVLNELANDGVKIETVSVGDDAWAEMDTLEDMKNLQNRLFSQEQQR